MPRDYGFAEMLAFSKGVAGATDKETIRRQLPGCVDVRETTRSLDLLGVDFVATLRRGAEVYIDVKTRRPNCARFWQTDSDGALIPELSLEIYSVVPSGDHRGKTGWTLDESKVTDYTLHTFPPEVTGTVYLLPFQLLRKAFIRNYSAWTRAFKVADQSSVGWTSRCVFVPAWCVLDAIRAEMVTEEAA